MSRLSGGQLRRSKGLERRAGFHRGGSLERLAEEILPRKQLTRRKPLAPGGPLERKTELQRTGPIASRPKVKLPKLDRTVRRALVRQNAGRARREPNEFSKDTRDALWLRSEGICEAWIGDRPCNREAAHAHHRRLRGRRGNVPGTNDITNAAHLCVECHAWAHGNVLEARDSYGLIVASTEDPAEVPMVSRHSDRGPVLFDLEGGWDVQVGAAA